MVRQPRVLSRVEIIDLIADGKAIIIYQQNVLNLTSWLPKHPGGDAAVHHMIGRDASDEMNAYHSLEAIAQFTNWRIGKIDYHWDNLLAPIQGAIYYKSSDEKRLDGEWSDLTESSNASEVGFKGLGFPAGNVIPKVPQGQLVTEANKNTLFPVIKGNVVDPKILMNNYDNGLTHKDLNEHPPLDYKTQDLIKEKYNALHKVVIDAGYYQTNYWNWAFDLTKVAALFLYSFLFLKIEQYIMSAIFMGIAWQQMTFMAHDASHISITHHYQFDNTFGMIISNWCGGLSLGWWKRSHNVHHLIPNDPVHDSDIQHLPFFAVSVRLFENLYSTFYKKLIVMDKAAELLVPFQNYMYYPLLAFGRFNLYVLSWEHVLTGRGPRQGRTAWYRYFEMAGLSFFFYWFFYLVVFKSVDGWINRIAFVLVSHMVTMIVHVQITLSHFAMSTADLGVSESFVQRQIRTTMDVDCPEWLDFFHGGLQFQAIHHLFPRLPRHNLRKVQPLVIEFCKDVGLKYSIYGFGEGNGIVLSKLEEVAKQCTIMLDAAKVFDGDIN